MEIFMSILLLLGGVGVFLAGMREMSKGLEQSAGGGIRKLFNKISGNRFMGYGIGIGATALVQSSSATSIMTIGLANARIIDTRQGSTIILGAKVGTTLTAFIFALSGLSKGGFSTGIMFASIAFVGAILLMVAKKDRVKSIAIFLLGFGMLFTGLEVMSFAINGAESGLKDAIEAMFAHEIFKNPVLLVLIGLIFTCIIQSSTAATAIFITFLTTGVLSSVDQSFFLVLGANIGTCSDGLMASIGGSADGKRLALFHLFTSTFGAVVFGIITAIFRVPIAGFFNSVIGTDGWSLALSLAIFNLFYNTVYTMILLPLLGPIVTLMKRIIKDKPSKHAHVLEHLNPQILQRPIMAILQARREIVNMGKRAAENLDLAFNALVNCDSSGSEDVFEKEEVLNEMNREISNYLIKMSSVTDSMASEVIIGSYHHVINDIERIGDHARNFMVLTVNLVNSQDKFTEESCAELRDMYSKVQASMALCLDIFARSDRNRLPEISAIEEEIDKMHKAFSKDHFRRLHDQSGFAEIQIYYDVISELERIGDHIVNIAFSLDNPTGEEVLKIGKSAVR